MANHEQRCPKCGTPGDGHFCGSCGAAMAPTQTNCEQCQVALSAGARYCHRCGRVVGGAAQAGSRTPWIVAGTVVVALVVAIGFRALGGINLITPDMANSGNQGSASALAAPAPDISQMTPRERFDRLFARVMEAGARQDSAVVMDFTPMALGAYDQLDVFDQQARYRAAMMGDTKGLGDAYREFLDHYDTQLEAGYPEYAAEQAMIESFREAALAGTTD